MKKGDIFLQTIIIIVIVAVCKIIMPFVCDVLMCVLNIFPLFRH